MTKLKLSVSKVLIPGLAYLFTVYPAMPRTMREGPRNARGTLVFKVSNKHITIYRIQ